MLFFERGSPIPGRIQTEAVPRKHTTLTNCRKALLSLPVFRRDLWKTRKSGAQHKNGAIGHRCYHKEERGAECRSGAGRRRWRSGHRARSASKGHASEDSAAEALSHRATHLNLQAVIFHAAEYVNGPKVSVVGTCVVLDVARRRIDLPATAPNSSSSSRRTSEALAAGRLGIGPIVALAPYEGGAPTVLARERTARSVRVIRRWSSKAVSARVIFIIVDEKFSSHKSHHGSPRSHLSRADPDLAQRAHTASNRERRRAWRSLPVVLPMPADPSDPRSHLDERTRHGALRARRGRRGRRRRRSRRRPARRPTRGRPSR